MSIRVAYAVGLCLSLINPSTLVGQVPVVPGRHIIGVTSSADGSQQPSYLIVPEGFRTSGALVPLVVSLHSWSFGLQQRNLDLEAEVAKRGWLYLFPDFRGS